tara:strand:- start:341 stop:850 length:510 start_codon:yes stop_codon:yes gene_type:complete
MRGKHAIASARRKVAQLEVQNEELCAKIRKLEADLKDALVIVKDRNALANAVTRLREQRDNATSEKLAKAQLRADKAIEARDKAQEARDSVDKHYDKLCRYYIAKHGGGSDGVEALGKFLTGEDMRVGFYTEHMKDNMESDRESKVERVMERMRRWKSERKLFSRFRNY